MASSNQDSSNAEALQALLQSFGPDAAQNVSQEALQRLSDKLSELMGADVVRDAFAYKDQEGQTDSAGRETLLGEEGLPIIDITEPEFARGQSMDRSSSGSSGVNDTASTLEEHPLINLSTLPSPERDLRKRERERILDLLEAEEVLEQRRERDKEARERREALDRKREDGKTERERLLELKETHKKMGKALLRSVISKDNDEKESNRPSSPSTASTSTPNERAISPNIKKKSVSFDTDDAVEAASSELPSKSSLGIADWGDVSQGRLRPNSKSLSADTHARQSEQLMKLQVVERVAGSNSAPGSSNAYEAQKKSAASKIQIIETSAGDSDDESDVGSVNLSDDDKVPEDSDTEHSDVEPNNLDFDEEMDWDSAQHQREIALEYYRKRDAIGKETAAALMTHSHEPDEDPELSLNQPKPTSSMSQFRANRLASSYAAVNAPASIDSSIPPTIVPADAAQTLQHAVRLGKLDEQGRLAGGEPGDSGSEPDDEVAREILELLQKGEIYNSGSNGEVTHTIPPNPSGHRSTAQYVPPPPFTRPTEPLPQKPKSSRFKLMQTDRLSSQSASVDSSGSSTPVSTVGRSSPKITMESSVVERAAVQPSSVSKQSIAASPLFRSSNAMIIESPSFPLSTTSQRRPEKPPAIMTSNVMESSSRKTDPGDSRTEAAPKRVSRFKAERM
ncbi:hypothetical protein F5890DRAFT_1487330 [Lentinula detonsa]|uniref:DUF3835 domain-containing protein n=1 Tax=Lentinula detonsa TaxID=2804962 RepID=A0AA38Q908_9AGAR|nr:hypothetical protein F5890DRAFT_1487330 [Lentinula detonsa]